jgi:hypothetical protein
MASNGVDPITGAKKFPEEDALQSGADLEEVDAHAVFLGTRPMGTTAEMLAYPYARKKLRWGNTDDDCEYEYRGSTLGWVIVSSPPITAGITRGAGWNQIAGDQHIPRLTVSGDMVFLTAGLVSVAGYQYTTLLTVPAPFRPTNGGTRGVGGGVTSGGIAYELSLTNGVLGVPSGYADTGSTIPQGHAHLIHAFWPRA